MQIHEHDKGVPPSREALSFFLKGGPSKGGHLFNHLLWSIFQLSLHILQITIFFTCWTSVGSFSCTSSTPVFLTCGYSSQVPTCFNVSLKLILTDMLPTELSWLGCEALSFVGLVVKKQINQVEGYLNFFSYYINKRVNKLFLHCTTETCKCEKVFGFIQR